MEIWLQVSFLAYLQPKFYMEKANKEGDTGEWALQDVMKDIDSKAEKATQSEIVPLH